MIGEIWDLIILSPMINVLIMLSHYLGGSFGLTIIVLTAVIRGLMYPLTLKQLRASKAMQSIQSQIAELRKKYAKDKQQLAKEQMKLYKESGMNPAGCLLPMLIQMPVWIALYQSIIRVLAVAPEGFLSLSQHLYPSWPLVFSLVPLESKFLWLDLALPDQFLLLPILVGGTMWVQQKMMMSPTGDPKQQAQSQMMLYTMPLMFAFLTLSFPSGLAIYWVMSNVISIATQYFVTGWGGLVSPAAGKRVADDEKKKKRVALKETPSRGADISGEDVEADIVESSAAKEGEEGYGKSGDKREDRGGSYTTRPGTARRKPGGSGGHRRKRR
ncbi:MAG: YidC/Oxa1 family membrane protein insertase [Dehalococcoidales bacterium]|nr:YidC/Oxa1 family membrane protein insertase [Dehalococcoidales bacterium]